MPNQRYGSDPIHPDTQSLGSMITTTGVLLGYLPKGDNRKTTVRVGDDYIRAGFTDEAPSFVVQVSADPAVPMYMRLYTAFRALHRSIMEEVSTP